MSGGGQAGGATRQVYLPLARHERTPLVQPLPLDDQGVVGRADVERRAGRNAQAAAELPVAPHRFGTRAANAHVFKFGAANGLVGPVEDDRVRMGEKAVVSPVAAHRNAAPKAVDTAVHDFEVPIDRQRPVEQAFFATAAKLHVVVVNGLVVADVLLAAAIVAHGAVGRRKGIARLEKPVAAHPQGTSTQA